MIKKLFLIIALFTIILLLTLFGIMRYQRQPPVISGKALKVGILHSLTGTMAISETPVVDATLFAINQINEAGGLLGQKIEPIVVDGKSDWPTFAKEAERLITKEKVAVVFGCWTSASIKTVKPVYEKYISLLIYPVQYEGLEESPYIVYTGATPNQQIIPGVVWCFQNIGKTFFLVGSDYVFPRTANEIIKELVISLQGKIVGEEYIILGSKDVDHIIEKIKTTQPAVIINTINGDSNIPFFKGLRAANITPERIPTMSFSIAEPELQLLDLNSMIGDYATWNYFQSIDYPENQLFIEQFKKKYGVNRVISDPMEAAYFGVHLWAQTVQKLGSFDIVTVREYIKNQVYNAPEGVVNIDSSNQHTWKWVRVGKIQSNGQFNIIWDSQKPVPPIPYPTIYRSKEAWDKFLMHLYTQWQNKWAAP
ncbi:MAG: urea ABC transporter substrate-binding protein [bacterium]|nr:urea ABC transporter substrate-binding protein [bacterium]